MDVVSVTFHSLQKVKAELLSLGVSMTESKIFKPKGVQMERDAYFSALCHLHESDSRKI